MNLDLDKLQREIEHAEKYLLEYAQMVNRAAVEEKSTHSSNLNVAQNLTVASYTCIYCCFVQLIVC